MNPILAHYDFSGRTVVVTGGAGILGTGLVKGIAQCGAQVIILDRKESAGETVAAEYRSANLKVHFVASDVLNREILERSLETIQKEFGPVDTLVNGAGGNNPKATTSADLKFFDLPMEALQFVINLNLMGTVLPSQIFGRAMAAQKTGNILNISSMNAIRPLTRIPGYSAAKAAVTNFTQWLAVHMAQEYSTNIRVNAIAPGFFLTEQNRFLLTDKDTGEMTARGRTIMAHTPMGRYGTPDDLLGATLWLLSPASDFVTGIVLPIDGGFSAFSGV